jgi:ligand-binding sensor domain-containing protein
MKPVLLLFHLVAVAVTLAGLSACTSNLALPPPPWQTPQLPPGWQLIRPPRDVQALALQSDLLWAGGAEGLFRIDRQTGEILPVPDNPPEFSVVHALLVDKETLWVGSQSGLYTYQEGLGWDRIPVGAGGLPDQRVNALYLDTQGHLWAGTWGGAAVYDGSSWERLTSADGLLDDMVNVILEDRYGGMWFGSYLAPRGGLSRLYQGTWEYFSTEKGLPHNNIVALLETQAGHVWVGTGLVDHGGAAELALQDAGKYSIVASLTKADGLAGEKVRSLYQDPGGVLWFGSEYDGLAIQMAGCWLLLNVRDGLAHPEIKVMLPEPGDGLWLGTKDGINHLSAEAISNLTCP